LSNEFAWVDPRCWKTGIIWDFMRRQLEADKKAIGRILGRFVLNWWCMNTFFWC